MPALNLLVFGLRIPAYSPSFNNQRLSFMVDISQFLDLKAPWIETGRGKMEARFSLYSFVSSKFGSSELLLQIVNTVGYNYLFLLVFHYLSSEAVMLDCCVFNQNHSSLMHTYKVKTGKIDNLSARYIFSFTDLI